MPVSLARVFDEDRRFLWRVCYRMTGNSADAEDLVQETFVRALERPPARQDEPWRPWLVKVALNRARDLLRKRRRAAYIGPWLPSPIETGEEASPASYETPTTDGRYDLIESVSLAFLVALERLSPIQRAVLLLRDVFDYSVRETAEALDVTEPNVKTIHHRARRAMGDYDATRCPPTRSHQERTRLALQQFLTHLGNHDVAAIEAMLTSDVRATNDGGGEFRAALLPIVGRAKVARLFAKLSEGVAIRHVAWIMVNGLPAVAVEVADPTPQFAPRFVLQCHVDRTGSIVAFHVVLASRKLTAVSFEDV